jgi:hypothetical protein
MNTRLNLWKDKKADLKLKNEEITQEMILKQTQKCEKRFDMWQMCIKSKSWNDEECVGKLKPKYEFCISKRNLMQTLLDNKIDEEF